MKSIILFDLDGTLIDPVQGITKAAQYALCAFGMEVPAESLTHYIGPPLRDSFREYAGMSADQAEEAVAKYREYFGKTGVYENTLYPGVKEMLAQLKASGKTLALATSKPWPYANQILERHSIEGHFSFVAGSEMNGDRSDKHLVIAYALENLTAKAQDAVMVGDRKHDIIGAQKTNVQSVGVLFGYGGLDELTAAGADHIAATVPELADLLLRL